MHRPIITDRLILRRWHEKDANALYKYASHPAVGPIAGWQPHTSVAESRDIILTVFSHPETYAVILKATGEPVGCVGIITGNGRHSTAMGDNEVEIGYWIGVPYWGKGLIPEAVQSLLRRCFTTLGVDAVWGCYYDGNTRSQRVLCKCGFTFHHTEQADTTPSGNTGTQHFMKITKEEWLKSPYAKQA